MCVCFFYSFQIRPNEKAKYMIVQPNLSFTYIFFFIRCLNNNFKFCVFFVVVVFFLYCRRFVHHKSLRYELNHLIAIIRLSQLVIGIDRRTRIFLSYVYIFIICVGVYRRISVYVCMSVINFCISFYLFKKKQISVI